MLKNRILWTPSAELLQHRTSMVPSNTAVRAKNQLQACVLLAAEQTRCAHSHGLLVTPPEKKQPAQLADASHNEPTLYDTC